MAPDPIQFKALQSCMWLGQAPLRQARNARPDPDTQ